MLEDLVKWKKGRKRDWNENVERMGKKWLAKIYNLDDLEGTDHVDDRPRDGHSGFPHRLT